MQFRVTADDGFAIEYNRPLGKQYKNGLHVNNGNSLIALSHFPPTTFTAKDQWSVDKDGVNKISGYWFQGHGQLYFKMEHIRPNINNSWSELAASNLNLTQEAYAPMISFQVYQDPQEFAADFNFADKRMGGLKMKWASLTGTPAWLYSEGPLGLPVVKFRNDSSMKMLSSFKIYSFMTMTVLIIFNALPNNSVNVQKYISMPGELGEISFQVRGNGTYGQGTIELNTKSGSSRPSAVLGTIKQGVPYLLCMRVNRSNESDIYSVRGLSAGIQELSVLEADPTKLKYTAVVRFPNSRQFSNPDTMESRSMIIGNGDIDIAWVRLYDYYLNSDGIRREVKNNWLIL